MKKVISLLMALVILVSFPMGIYAQDKDVPEAEYEVLPWKTDKTPEVRARKQVDGLRMYVDKENPLFMIRNCPIPGKSQLETTVQTYYSLPDDVRNFAVIYNDYGPTFLTPQEQLDFWEELLTYTDAHNVPVVLQSECFCTNKTRDPFTQEQLSDLFEKHPTLIGFVQVELSTNGVTNEKLAYDEVTEDNGVNKNILARMKSCIKACKENGGLFIWQDMEYIYWKKTCYVNHILKDKELYDLLKSCPENVIIMDKHNGDGRHFSSQANILGCWLDDVCGNWGVNIENWLWYEEGFYEYDSLGKPSGQGDPRYTIKYPPALSGIDMIADLVAGATVFSFEGAYCWGAMYYHHDGNIIYTPAAGEVLYPIYQHILNYAVPSKEQVKEQIKVGYKMTFPASYPLRGNDARLLQGLYCDKISTLRAKLDPLFNNGTKTWVPNTGRYYVIPILPIYSNPKEILPESEILNDFKYFTKGLFIDSVKKNYFNNFYEEKYKGNGVLFDINDYIYVFNSNENKTIATEQNVQYTLPKSNIEMNTTMVAHTYAIIDEKNGKINIDMCNLRPDTDDVCAGIESEHSFMMSYAFGGRMSLAKNFRETVFEFTGFEEEPVVKAEGSNNARMKKEWNEETSTLTLSIISNSGVRISIG